MRWLTFVILACLAVVLQTSLAPRLRWGGAVPDWLLVLVVFYSLHARTSHTVAAGWLVGAMGDLMTIERFGLLSLGYALVAGIVQAVRSFLFTHHPLAQIAVTLMGALVVRLWWLVYRTMFDLPLEGLSHLLWSCLYTALWAPPVHWFLLKMPGLLGFRAVTGRRGGPAGMRV